MEVNIFLCDVSNFFCFCFQSSDQLTLCYKFGTFFKLDEFMDFRERLNNSLHYTTTAVDRIILNIVQCSSLDGLYNIDTSPKDNKIDFNALMYDLNLFLCFNCLFVIFFVVTIMILVCTLAGIRNESMDHRKRVKKSRSSLNRI